MFTVVYHGDSTIDVHRVGCLDTIAAARREGMTFKPCLKSGE